MFTCISRIENLDKEGNPVIKWIFSTTNEVAVTHNTVFGGHETKSRIIVYGGEYKVGKTYKLTEV